MYLYVPQQGDIREERIGGRVFPSGKTRDGIPAELSAATLPSDVVTLFEVLEAWFT